MADLGEGEIGEQMANIKEEWRQTVDGMKADATQVPSGMSRAEFQEWKKEQTERAKSRLGQLEERLKRLQTLDGKLRRLKANGEDVSESIPGAWSLPNAANGNDVADDPSAKGHSPEARPSKDVPASYSPWVEVEDEVKGYDQNGGRTSAVPLYARPVTPGTIRQIIREEMRKGHGVAPSTPMPVVHERRTPEPLGGGSEDEKLANKKDSGKTGTNLAPPPVDEEGDAWGQVMDKMDDMEEHNPENSERRPSQEQRVTGEPKTLDDAVPLSCPLLFGGFSRRSPIRQKCFEIQNSTMWASIFLLVTLANSLYIAMGPEIIPEERNQTTILLEYFDYACVLVLAFEVVVGSIALGFVRSEITYLRCSDFHKLDFIVLIVTITEYIARYFDVQGVTLRPFRLLRVFRAITRIKTFAGIKSIILTLKQGLPQLSIVFAMLLFFMAAFSICGMAIYQNSFRRRCVSLAVPVPACSSDFSTGWAGRCDFRNISQTEIQPEGQIIISGGYPFEQWCKIYKNTSEGQYDGKYPMDPYGRYHNCQLDRYERAKEDGTDFTVTQMCEEFENPRNELQHFDHIGGAMLTLAQVVAPDGYYDVLWQSLESEPVAVPLTWLLYFSISCLCTFLLLGLFVAVVTGTFKRVREQYGTAFRSQEVEDQITAEATPKIERRSSGEGEEDGDEAMRRAAQTFILSARFHHFMSLSILAHALAMASDQYNAPETWKQYAEYTYIACNMIFLVETILRFLASDGVGDFWQSKFNKFELAMVMSGIIGLITKSPLLLLIPALRLYRLMSYFPTLEALLLSAVASVRAILNLCLFILIVALCFAVTGRYVFGKLMDDLTRSNFGTFQSAMLTIFQLLTGDSWSAVLFAAMSSKTTTIGQLFAALFVITWFVFSALIVNNLFVAVIIENFEVAKTIEDIGKPGRLKAVREMLQKSYQQLYVRSTAVISGQLQVDVNTGNTYAGPGAIHSQMDANRKEHRGASYEEDLDNQLLVPTSSQTQSTVDIVARRGVLANVIKSVTVPTASVNEEEDEDEPERVLFCLLPNNPIRRFFIWLGNQPIFDVVVYTAIMASCAFLMITPPYSDLPDQPPLVAFETMDFWNSVFTFVFIVEFLIRVMSQGLLLTKNAYLQSGWNIMDSVVLLFAIIEETGIMAEGGIAKVFRLARALRPLRLMKRNQGMRVVIDALISTLAPVAYVILFSTFTFLVFSLIGMGLFGGKMYRCTSPVADYPLGKRECFGNYVYDEGILAPSAWVNPPFNFDSFSSASLTLFRVNTIKYVGILTEVMDITELNQSPKKGHSEVLALFFVVYLIVGALFVMNLFVGFIVDGFNANKGSSEADIQYNRFFRQLQSHRPKYDVFKAPQNKFAAMLRRLVGTKYFQIFSALCVFINVIFMLADHANASDGFVFALTLQNDIFYFELVLEIIIYAFAFGVGGFYNDPWKAFDFFVALGSSAMWIPGSNPKIAQFAKSFRLMRVIRLMKMIRPIRIILETLLQSLPQLLNILLLLFLVYSMFAVVAVQMFGTTRYGRRLGPTANFESWQNAMYTVYQMVTGDEWMDIMYDCMVSAPWCTPVFKKSENYDGPSYSFGDCGHSSARYFFIAFVLVCQNVMLNLFIGMILDNFSFITDEVAQVEDENWVGGASSRQVAELSTVFQKYDSGTGKMPIKSLHALMSDLPRPMGCREWDDSVRITKYDKATIQMIRAELNVIVLHDREMEHVRATSWKRHLQLPKFKSEVQFSTGLDFEDIMLTILHWRKPSMVPHVTKYSRHQRIEEVVLMAHALMVMDFFQGLVAKRKRNETKVALAQRSLFFRWASTETHRKRRAALVEDMRSEDKTKAEKMHQSMTTVMLPPSRTETILLEDLESVPEDIIWHHNLVKDAHGKMPKPMHGVDVFRSRCKSDLVVLQFIDPTKSEWGPLAIDLSGVDWGGWHLRNTELDSFFEPETFGKGSHGTGKWVRVDFQKQHEQISDDFRLVGSIQDLQSFVVAETAKGGKKTGHAKSTVRINLGSHVYMSLAENNTKTVKGLRGKAGATLDDDKLDGVAEVLGYITGAAKHHAGTRPPPRNLQSTNGNFASRFEGFFASMAPAARR